MNIPRTQIRETLDARLETLFSEVKELRITWIDSDGTVLFDNDNSVAQLENHSDRPEVQEAFRDGEGESDRKSDTMDMNTYYYATLLEDGTVPPGGDGSAEYFQYVCFCVPGDYPAGGDHPCALCDFGGGS